MYRKLRFEIENDASNSEILVYTGEKLDTRFMLDYIQYLKFDEMLENKMLRMLCRNYRTMRMLVMAKRFADEMNHMMYPIIIEAVYSQGKSPYVTISRVENKETDEIYSGSSNDLIELTVEDQFGMNRYFRSLCYIPEFWEFMKEIYSCSNILTIKNPA